MNETFPSARRVDPALASSIRSQAVWAAIGAVVLLYFGYTYNVVADSTSARLLVYTLRYGGMAMVVSTVVLATGRPIGLLLDGVFSIVIGLALALAGALWVVETKSLAFDSILELVFGYLFLTAGVRNFREFCRLGAHPEADAETEGPTPIPPVEAYATQSPEAREHTSAPEGYLSSFADDDTGHKPRD